MKTLFIRISVILFWVMFLLGFLYLPTGKWIPLNKKSLNVFAWGDILDPAVIAEFEAATGIKVHLNYYSSNEELVVKLLATKGEGYDLIIPSDYSVQVLREKGLLKQLDKSKLSFFSQLNPLLLNRAFDPDNRFSIPFEWELFVLGIDKHFFPQGVPDPSWKMIFDPAFIRYRIAMINDPIEALLIASFYLYGDVPHPLTPLQLQGVIHLLKEQKKWVTAYADFRADYFLASKNCPVVVSSTSYILRTMRRFDFVGFVVPKEGTFVTIENLCIPKSSQKEALAYKLINFLYQPKSMAAHFNTFGVFPATLDVLDSLEVDPQTKELLQPSPESFEKFHFTTLVASQQAMRDAWVQVKSAE